MSYFLLRKVGGELEADGPFTARELEKRLEPCGVGETACYYGHLVFFQSVAEVLTYRRNDGRDTVAACVVKGEVVLPRALTVVTKVELP